MTYQEGGSDPSSSGVIDWTRYFAAAVMEFKLGMGEAWALTPQEFWVLYDWQTDKIEAEGGKRPSAVPPMTRAEMEALEKEVGLK